MFNLFCVFSFLRRNLLSILTCYHTSDITEFCADIWISNHRRQDFQKRKIRYVTSYDLRREIYVMYLCTYRFLSKFEVNSTLLFWKCRRLKILTTVVRYRVHRSVLNRRRRRDSAGYSACGYCTSSILLNDNIKIFLLK